MARTVADFTSDAEGGLLIMNGEARNLVKQRMADMAAKAVQQDDIESQDGPKCPHCGNVHTESEYYQDMVTYWGASSEVETECEECDSTFFVKEQVTRVWESTKNSRTSST